MNSEAVPPPGGPNEALELLLDGNGRHRDGNLQLRDHSGVGEELAGKQQPFAAIISCADSRVSPTLIFYVARGNIFVSKVAGNSIDTGTLGSTEYAVEVLAVKLVLVLGHSDCGAVRAGIAVANGEASYPPGRYGAIGEVVGRVVPAIQGVPPADRSLPHCVSVNAAAQADDIASRGPIIKQAADAGRLKVVPAVYDIKTRRVSLV